MSQRHAQFVRITPEIAREFLASNTKNRNIMQTRLEKYKDDLRRGLWETTHQGIAFDVNGRLIDGQHRLMAISETGIATTMLVVRGLDEKAFLTIDSGAPKTSRDLLVGLRPTSEYRTEVTSVARGCLRGMDGGLVDVKTCAEFAARKYNQILPFAKAFKEMPGQSGVSASFANAVIIANADPDTMLILAVCLIKMEFNGFDVLRTLRKRLEAITTKNPELLRYALTVSALRKLKDKTNVQVLRPDTKEWERNELQGWAP